MPPAWEYGSEFHWVDPVTAPQGPILPPGAVLFASGRDALRALIHAGIASRGWRRFLLPSYFCPEVAAAIAATGVEIGLYDDSPLEQAPVALPGDRRPGDVVFLVNYFGLRSDPSGRLDVGPAELVEDHTHDPWSDWARQSRADYCLVALRKTLPVPDGAAVWSPKGHSLPDAPPPTAERQSAVLAKLTAMLLKRRYLEGHPVDKDVFRQLQLDGEARIATGDVSGPSRLAGQLLATLPWDAWRRRRAENHTLLRQALAEPPGIEVLAPADDRRCPFSLIVKCESPELRQRLRSQLIAQRIYPAVLWPIDGEATEPEKKAAELSRRLLSLPCDFRYAVTELLRVAAAVREVLSEATSCPPPGGNGR